MIERGSTVPTFTNLFSDKTCFPEDLDGIEPPPLGSKPSVLTVVRQVFEVCCFTSLDSSSTAVSLLLIQNELCRAEDLNLIPENQENRLMW